MKLSTAASLTAAFVMLATSPGVVPVLGQTKIIPPPRPPARTVPLDPNFKTVIAVCSHVATAAYSGVPVLLQVLQTGSKPVPKKVTVWLQGPGTLIYDDRLGTGLFGHEERNSVDVPAGGGPVCLYLQAVGLGFATTVPDIIYVTAADDPHDFLGDPVFVGLSGMQVDVKVVAAPTTVPADGLATAVATARVTDSGGKPIANVPCIMSWAGPMLTTGYDAAGSVSDANGMVSFTIPPSKREGPAYVEFVAQCGSAQAVYNYVAPKSGAASTPQASRPGRAASAGAK